MRVGRMLRLYDQSGGGPVSMFDSAGVHGRARRFGRDVSTDYIISSSRKKETIDTDKLKEHIFEDIDPGFFSTLRPNDIIVAGANFGCGSAMEIAVTVLLAAGIRVVVAESFARTFLRNAFNNGLVPLTADVGLIKEGELISLSGLDTGNARVRCADGREIACEAIPVFMLDMLKKGGLVPYMKANKRFIG